MERFQRGGEEHLLSLSLSFEREKKRFTVKYVGGGGGVARATRSIQRLH